jgi:hypothetical protein
MSLKEDPAIDVLMFRSRRAAWIAEDRRHPRYQEERMARYKDANFKLKHAPITRARKLKLNPEVSPETRPLASAALAGLMEELASPPPDSPVTAVTEEQPLPVMMAAMALWGVGFTAFMLIPMAVAAVAASPLIVAADWFRRS